MNPKAVRIHLICTFFPYFVTTSKSTTYKKLLILFKKNIKKNCFSLFVH